MKVLFCDIKYPKKYLIQNHYILFYKIRWNIMKSKKDRDGALKIFYIHSSLMFKFHYINTHESENNSYFVKMQLKVMHSKIKCLCTGIQNEIKKYQYKYFGVIILCCSVCRCLFCTIHFGIILLSLFLSFFLSHL